MNETVVIAVGLSGLRPLMFDRYLGGKSTVPTEEKLYRFPDGGVYLPARNLISFLSARHSESAAKRFFDPKKYKAVSGALLSYVDVSPFEIPITRRGKPIMFTGKWDPDNIAVQKDVARLKDGAANPKERPVIALPWEVAFDLTLVENGEIEIGEVKRLFELGGLALGLGTFRGVFGKFEVTQWKPKKKGK